MKTLNRGRSEGSKGRCEAWRSRKDRLIYDKAERGTSVLSMAKAKVGSKKYI